MNPLHCVRFAFFGMLKTCGGLWRHKVRIVVYCRDSKKKPRDVYLAKGHVASTTGAQRGRDRVGEHIGRDRGGTARSEPWGRSEGGDTIILKEKNIHLFFSIRPKKGKKNRVKKCIIQKLIHLTINPPPPFIRMASCTLEVPSPFPIHPALFALPYCCSTLAI